MNLSEAISKAREWKNKRLLDGKYDNYSVVQFTSGLRVIRDDRLRSMHRVVFCTDRDKFGGTVNTDEQRVA